MKHYIIFFIDNKVVDVHSFSEAEYEDFQQAIDRTIERLGSLYKNYSIQTISC